jgi:hypothetical protein
MPIKMEWIPIGPFTALMTLLELIVKNTLWIEVDRTLNIMPTTFDNKGCHTREDDDVLVLVERATAEKPIEYSVTTVTTLSATKDVSVNGTCVAYKENAKRETTPAKRKWQRWIQKRQKSH